ncbi:Short-chain dehydrogenase/reductase SDR [Penicillium cf. griseofulvum]|uniref:Short-chain dehydrogenase/reductase SDR n=1 Tax=Penicillium cf. griseofulvum TaxID=2972120 RepID=A0A9W9T2J5_9EURO|nr:Short-chain dehydrogenase/reductase SDR [Penicillium cf. griseofulvum]KAJ5440542.1 Short-chain dehydrogenase/reductase SDR [Penicillium cf. griseofulvum]
MVLSQPPNQHVMKAFDLTGKVAVVTGGARGIGLEVSRGLAEAGANVALIYHTSNAADTIAVEIASTNNVRAAAYKANVAIQSEIEAVVQQIARDFGQLDIMVVNSGIASSIAAEDYTPDQWSEIMKVNLDGAFYSAQAAGRIFKEQGHGNIIFTASVSATLVNLPQKQAAYNASKAGVVQLSKCLSVEWVDYCRVNCISPGYIATEILDGFPKEWRDKWFDLIPAKRMAESYELKGAYVFCASDASSYMTGANLVIDGGYTLP